MIWPFVRIILPLGVGVVFPNPQSLSPNPRFKEAYGVSSGIALHQGA